MAAETHMTDSEGRVTLPKPFANASVIVEQVSDTEVRIRKAPAEDTVSFYEESLPALSPRDQELLAKLLADPPPPNEALRKATAEYKERYGPVTDRGTESQP